MSDIRQDIDPYSQSFFTLKNRVMRQLWSIVWFCLFLPSPRPFHAWRSFLLRLFGARLGEACHVYPRARIWAPWNLIMEDQASLADDVICYSMAEITLRKAAIVSQGAHLCTGSHDYKSDSFQLFAKPIEIGAGAWVCAEVFVHPGVKIGDRSVVSARSVVKEDLPPDMVCSGNPCSPIKPR